MSSVEENTQEERMNNPSRAIRSSPPKKGGFCTGGKPRLIQTVLRFETYLFIYAMFRSSGTQQCGLLIRWFFGFEALMKRDRCFPRG